MIRAALLLLGALTLGMAVPSYAQSPAPAAASPSISADQAHVALDVLNDPAKRAAFAATLNAIVKAQSPNAAPATDATTGPAASAPPAGTAPAASSAASSAAPPAPAPTPAPAKPATQTTVEGLTIPLAPDSLGAQVLLSASAFVNHVGNQAMEALETVQSLPLLYGWAIVMATNPVARDILEDVSWRLILALACAAAVEYGLRRAMRRPIRSLESLAPSNHSADPDAAPAQTEVETDAVARAEAGEIEAPMPRPRPSAWTLMRRVPLVIARLVLELVPVLGIVLIGHLIAGSSLGGQIVSRLIILASVDAYAISAALLCIMRMLLSPGESRLRLFHLQNAAADYLMCWSRRLILIGVFGYAIGEAGLILGLSEIGHDAFEKGVGLLLHLCLAFIVVQKRRAVRRVLRAPPGATGLVAALRNRFASVWHWVVLFFLIAGWLIWAVEVPHGYAAVIHYFIVTALVLIGARIALLLLLGLVDRVMRPGAQPSDFYPGMQARLVVYHPAVTLTTRLIIYLLCGLGLLQLYGLNTFMWLVNSDLGLRILAAIGTVLLTTVLAFGVWEAINVGVQQHLDRLQREAQLAKSARLRTLLPLLRSTLLITLAIVAGLMILSEIGINIAPLLAGAGIVGVAIGFGSQKLVQDLITGIFLLLENAMQVGDTVTVSGLTGTVENLSVRTIRLRAGDGSVHIIPFSSVTSVTNVNRGLGNASVVVSVAYDEDTDRVSQELTSIVSGMRAEPTFSAMMLSDFQLWGVDKVDGGQVTIAGQVVCTDAGRWAVQREFNRRMKRRFQELGIRIFNPVQTISVTVPVQTPAAKGDDHAHAQAAD
ncbi:MAG TPA: mechanosensitive ion channel domain-containing protein [Rhodopila sp.]